MSAPSGSKKNAPHSTIVEEEIRHFSKDSPTWWDEDGAFKPLHRLNPARLDFLKSQICTHYGRDEQVFSPLTGLRILDIGCGGGLVCEPLNRLGGAVTGIDGDAKAINVAQEHARYANLEISYIHGDAADLEEQFDVVTALEIIEHTNAPQVFIEICAQRVKPNGLLVLSTLNRTAKSYAFGILAAEYILRWIPRGTHQWKKFLRPSEVTTFASNAGLTPLAMRGLVFDPLKNDFRLSQHDVDVNYLISFRKEP